MTSPHPPAAHRTESPAPLLFLFLIPLLAVVGLVVWIGSGLTWGLVAVALIAIALFTTFIVIAFARRLNDEDDER